MPHYQDGTPAKVTDEVVCMDLDGVPRSGVVVNVIESSSCNLTVAVARLSTQHRYNPATGACEPFYSFPTIEHRTFTARSCEREDLMRKRILEERKAAEDEKHEAARIKRDELQGEVLELFDEPAAEHDHGELSG